MIISIFNTTEQRKGGYTPSPWTSPAPPSQTTSALGKTGGRPRGTARLLEIDFLRLVSMLAVISIHVSSTYLSYETGHLFLGMNLAFLPQPSRPVQRSPLSPSLRLLLWSKRADRSPT
ncbi:MAG: hypothetical protein ACLT9P_05540 [Evtepia gabavorous]